MYKLIVILFISIAGIQSLSAQCPGKDFILGQIKAFQSSKKIPLKEQLNELLKYDTIINNCRYQNDSVYTLLLLDIGALYYYLNDFESAVLNTNKALQIIRSNPKNPAVNQKEAITLYYYLTIYYDSLHLISKKNEAADSCIASEKRLGTDYTKTCILLAFRVESLFYKGDYLLCEEYCRLGEILMRKFYHYSDSMAHIDFFITNTVIALIFQKKFREAEAFLESRKPRYLKTKTNEYLSSMNLLSAQLSRANGDYPSAVSYLKTALQYDLKTKEKYLSGEILNQTGMIYYEQLKQGDGALRYYRKALQYALPVHGVIIFGNMAEVYTAMRKFDSAHYFLQKAFDIISPGINENDLLQNTQEYIETGTAEYILNIVLSKANACMQEYYAEKNNAILSRALRIYKIADRLLNTMKTGQLAVGSQLIWRNYTRKLYEQAIEASRLSNLYDDAFYFFEKSRAVLLNDQVNEQKLLSDAEMIKLTRLKKKILASEREFASVNPASSRADEIIQEQYNNNQEMDKLRQAIQSNNKVYFRSIADTGFISLKDIQHTLFQHSQSLIELFAGDSATYVLTITATSSKLKKIDKSAYDSAVARFIAFTASYDLMNKQFTTFTTTAARLYQLIFNDSPLPPGRLIISPDGHYYPFESLITSKSGESVHYLLQDHAVSYTYSARFLLDNAAPGAVSAAKNLIGFAPVNYPGSFSLTSLPGSGESLNTIAGYFSDASKLVAAGATRQNFLSRFSQYQILQLYTHASDSSKNNEPVIYFADSALYLSDLIGGKKPLTKLVVLSACETGSGKDYKGEGVFSFNRAFAALGIPSCVSNLWTVDNQSTYKITELFYKYVASGRPLDEALQKAKLEFINGSVREKQLPYFWAAAVLVGNADSLKIHQRTNWALYAMILVVPILFIIIRAVYRRKRVSVFRIPPTDMAMDN